MGGILLGSPASFFFAVTFVLNRAMDLSGGIWIWSAVLRHLFMLPPLLLLVARRGNLHVLLTEMRKEPRVRLGRSSVGFGPFYSPLCFAAAYGPVWSVASTWQHQGIAMSLTIKGRRWRIYSIQCTRIAEDLRVGDIVDEACENLAAL